MGPVILSLVLGTVVTWIILVIVVPISQKLSDFSFPPWSEALWKLAVVSAAITAAGIAGDQANWFVGFAASFLVLFILMYKWFDVDFRGVIIICVASAILSRLMAFLLMVLALKMR